MAQASSAQREPSMEEILASIRRIIEDSDVEKRREAEEAVPVIAAPANDPVDRSKGVEAFRAEFRDPLPVEEPAAESEIKHMTESSRETPVSDLSNFHSQNAVPVEPSARGETVEPVDEIDITLDLAVEEPAPSPLAAEDPLDAPVEPAAVPAADGQPRAPLISERAGRQVAAAFGELSEAFAASRRRSFDEMAEEMLRPMLQDWLDNNLPHLVERLVREEIERIARG